MADVATKFGLGAAGPLNGAPAPKYITGRYYRSSLVYSAGASVTTTATRLYYVPIFISEVRQFAGFVMRNDGAGDNGEKVRMGLYTHTAVGPTTLVQAATEVTFAGAAADNVTSDAFTPTQTGWHWLAGHFDSASTVRGTNTLSGVTTYQFSPPDFATFFGLNTVSSDDIGVVVNPPGFLYVDTTYGALASTAVAPTAGIYQGPWLGLKA